MSETDSRLTDRHLEEIDLRGLVCSTSHEYRVREIPAEFGFIDEHPYAIIKGDRAAAIAMVRAFFDFALQESSGQRLTVRLYSIGEEFYIEVAGEPELFRGHRIVSSKEEPPNIKDVTSRRHRLGLTKGWLRFSNSAEPGATLTMSFGSS